MCHILPCFWSSARTSRHCLHSGIDGLLQALRRDRARLRIRCPDNAAVAHSRLQAHALRAPSAICHDALQVPMLRLLCMCMTAARGNAT